MGTLAITSFITGQRYKLTLGNATSFHMDFIDPDMTSDGFFTATDTTGILTGIGSQVWTGSAEGTFNFTPEKFVTHERKVYVRTRENLLLLYGGDDNTTYDRCVATIKTPWLDDKRPATFKGGQAISTALLGAWTLSAGTDPISEVLTDVAVLGSPTAPNENSDSTYDTGKIPFESRGTHFQLEAVSSDESAEPAKISSLVYYYNMEEVP